MHRRAGTHGDALCKMGPGSAAHRHSASKTRVNALMALRSIRGTLCVSDSIFKPQRHSLQSRHCENASRESAPDDRLHEAIHQAAQRKMDCFAPLAMTPKRAFTTPRRDAPELCIKLPPNRG